MKHYEHPPVHANIEPPPPDPTPARTPSTTTMRDKFATAALNEILRSGVCGDVAHPSTAPKACALAYQYADAMISARGN